MELDRCVTIDVTQRDDEYRQFVGEVQPRLRVAFVAAYGPEEGRLALADALSWAWEHWDRVRQMDNAAGYLYRVGRTAARRNRWRQPPVLPAATAHEDVAPVSRELVDAVSRLPPQQRRAVLLVHAFGWSQVDVAHLLGVSASSVKQALDRGMRRLRQNLDVGKEHGHERPRLDH